VLHCILHNTNPTNDCAGDDLIDHLCPATVLQSDMLQAVRRQKCQNTSEFCPNFSYLFVGAKGLLEHGARINNGYVTTILTSLKHI
jgi:hypothetical protein